MSGHTLTYRTVKLADCFGVDELPVQKTIYDRLKRVKRASTMEQDAVQPSSPTKKRGSLSRKGTGFPEPFCGGTFPLYLSRSAGLTVRLV